MSNETGDKMAVGSLAMPFAQTRTEPRPALAQLFAEHHRRVLSAAYRITGSMADAEDVAQTIFLRVAVAADDVPLTNTGSYLYRAAVNGALDLLRRRKTAAAEPLDQAAELPQTGRYSSPEHEASSRQLGTALRAAIAELSPRAAEIFTLRYIEGLDNKEVATLMHTSQAIVAVTLHQAKSKLKKRLTDSGWERS